jgi:hypothetical protein
MKVRTVLFATCGLLVMFIGYAGVAETYFDYCGLSQAQATSRVLEELALRGFDKRYLSGPAEQKGTCSYSFDFEDQGQKLNYVVMSTWLHAVKLNTWDFKRDEEERANPKFQQTPNRAAEH